LVDIEDNHFSSLQEDIKKLVTFSEKIEELSESVQAQKSSGQKQMNMEKVSKKLENLQLEKKKEKTYDTIQGFFDKAPKGAKRLLSFEEVKTGVSDSDSWNKKTEELIEEIMKVMDDEDSKITELEHYLPMITEHYAQSFSIFAKEAQLTELQHLYL